MPVFTTPDRIPAPTDTGEPPAAFQLQDLAARVQTLLTSLRSTVTSNFSSLTSSIDNARNVNLGTAVGTGSPINVATGHLPIPSADFLLSAGVSATVSATFDVIATTVNGACTFSGRLNSVNLNAPADNYLARAAVRRPTASGDRATVSQTWTLGPTSYGRRIQLVVVKDNSNAALTVDPTNCTISWVLSRNGS